MCKHGIDRRQQNFGAWSFSFGHWDSYCHGSQQTSRQRLLQHTHFSDEYLWYMSDEEPQLATT